MARRPGKEIRVSATDALEFEPEEAPKRRIPTTVWLLLALVLITVAGLGGFLFGDRLADIGAEGGGEIPVVHAAEGPIKVRPKNPGGAEIPYRGYDINKRMKGENASTRVEKLLPAPEKPLSPPTASPKAQPAPSAPARPAPVAAASGTPSATAESLLPPAPPPAPAPKAPVAPVKKPPAVVVPPPPVAAAKAPPQAPAPAPSSTTPSKAASAAPAKTASQASGGAPLKLVPKSKQPSQPAASVSMKPLKPIAPPVTVTGTRVPPSVRARTTTTPQTATVQGWQVQLAASRSAKAARTEGERMKKKHSDLLGKMRVGVVRADLGTRGVFYRIRLGPARDKADARAICASLSKRGQGCLIVAPGK